MTTFEPPEYLRNYILLSLKHVPTPSQVALQLSPTDANPKLKSG